MSWVDFSKNVQNIFAAEIHVLLNKEGLDSLSQQQFLAMMGSLPNLVMQEIGGRILDVIEVPEPRGQYDAEKTNAVIPIVID